MIFQDKAQALGLIGVRILRKNGDIEYPEFAITRNGICDAGFNDMLGVYFHVDTQASAWYALLIAASPTLSASDTIASHSGWTEVTAYSNSTRVAIPFNASASKSIANTTTANFNINADGTVVSGIGVVNNSTKGGTSGKLWATGLFGSAVTLNNGDVLQITYQMSLA
jgi:hypothetical protein